MAATPPPDLPTKRSVDDISTMPGDEESMTVVKEDEDEHSLARKKVKRDHDSPQPGIVKSKSNGKTADEVLMDEAVKVEETNGKTGAVEKAVGLQWPARDRDQVVFGRPGKVDNDQSGWGRLPRHLLTRILTLAAEDIPLAPTLEDAWSRGPATPVLLRTLTARVWLVSLRTLCSEWRVAVDDLPFWLTFYLAAQSTLDPLPPSERQSTRQVVPSNLAICRFYWGRVCFPCHFHKPCRNIVIDEDDFDDSVYIRSLGTLPLCRAHAGVCSGCGTSYIHREVISRRDFWNRYSLAYTVAETADRETDAEGQMMAYESFLCKPCRIESVRYQLRQKLMLIARGGPVRGLQNPYLRSKEVGLYAAGPEQEGANSSRTAYLTLEVAWLRNALGAHWEKLLEHACEAQHNEAWGRHLFGENVGRETEEEKQDIRRVHGLMFPLTAFNEWNASVERQQLEREWCHELAEFGDLDEPSEPPETYEGLNDKFRTQLVASCKQHLAIARVKAGVWVYPSQEVDLLAGLPAEPAVRDRDIEGPMPPGFDLDGRQGDPLLPVLAQLIRTTQHPFPAHIDESRQTYPYHRNKNLGTLPVPMSTASDPGPRSTFAGIRDDPDKEIDQVMPHVNTVRALDGNFEVALRIFLTPVFKRLVEIIWTHSGGGHMIQNIELDREMEGWGIDRVLEELRNEEVWMRAPSVSRRRAQQQQQHLRRSQEQAAHDQSRSAPMERSVHSSGHQPHPQHAEPGRNSPKIELVQDDTTYDPSRGIVETENDIEHEHEMDVEPQTEGEQAAGHGDQAHTRAVPALEQYSSSPIQPPASQAPIKLIRSVNVPARSDPDISITSIASADITSENPSRSGTSTPSESTMEDPVPVTPITPVASRIPEQDDIDASAVASKDKAKAQGDRQDPIKQAIGKGDDEDISIEVCRGRVREQTEGTLDRLQAMGAQTDAAAHGPNVSRMADNSTGTAVTTPRRSPVVDSPIPPRASQMPTQIIVRAVDALGRISAVAGEGIAGGHASEEPDIDGESLLSDVGDAGEGNVEHHPIGSRDSDYETEEDLEMEDIEVGEVSDTESEGGSSEARGMGGGPIMAFENIPFIPQVSPKILPTPSADPSPENGTSRQAGNTDADGQKDGQTTVSAVPDVSSVLAVDLIMSIFKQARAPLRVCVCSICARAARRASA